MTLLTCRSLSTCHSRHVTLDMSLSTCHSQHVTLDMSLSTCHSWHVTLNMPLSTYYSRHVTLDMSPLTCYSWQVTINHSRHVTFDMSLLTCRSWCITHEVSFLTYHSGLATLDVRILQGIQVRRSKIMLFWNFLVQFFTWASPRGARAPKNGKIWEKFPKRAAPPPPPSEISDIFENCWPPPLGSNSDIFDFPTFLIKVILQNNCKIIEIGTFLKNWDPPPGCSKFPNWNWDFFEKKFTPPPPLGNFSPNFSFFLWWLP